MGRMGRRRRWEEEGLEEGQAPEAAAAAGAVLAGARTGRQLLAPPAGCPRALMTGERRGGRMGRAPLRRRCSLQEAVRGRRTMERRRALRRRRGKRRAWTWRMAVLALAALACSALQGAAAEALLALALAEAEKEAALDQALLDPLALALLLLEEASLEASLGALVAALGLAAWGEAQRMASLALVEWA
jgi:hypothetical protein